MSKRIVLAGTLTTLALAAALGWHLLSAAPAPPEFARDEREPAVAEAIDAAGHAVRQAPRSAAAWGRLGQLAAANSYPAQARLCLARAAELDPADPRWPYLLEHVQAATLDPAQRRALWQRALQHARGEAGAIIHWRLALALLEAGSLDAAEQHLHALAEAEPDSPRSQYGLGLLAAARDERAAARTRLGSIQDSPYFRKRVHGQLAALALADGDRVSADFHQRRAAQLPDDPDFPDPLLDELYEHAVNREALYRRLRQLESQGRWRDMVALLRPMIAAAPEPRAQLALGNALTRLGEPAEAEQVFTALLERDQRNVSAQHGLGLACFLRAELLRGTKTPATMPAGDGAHQALEQAIAAEGRALALAPDFAPAHLVRGQALARLGRRAEALAALRDAVLCKADWADAHLALGEALAEAGQLPEALHHLQDAVRLAPAGDSRAPQALERWQRRRDGTDAKGPTPP